MDMKLELVMVPVTDVDRAKEFYEKVGFVVDHDQTVSDDVRFVQLTPPGSACSIAIGKGLTRMEPGSLDNMQMVIADADATHADLVARGIEVSEVDELAWGRFVFFADPDGNGWALQQLPDWSAPPAARATTRKPERVSAPDWRPDPSAPTRRSARTSRSAAGWLRSRPRSRRAR